jgi:hypothetical protein
MSSLSDTVTLDGTQQVSVHFSQSCPPGAHSDYSEFQTAISQMPSVQSVASVYGDTVATLSNIFSLQTNYYIAVINPTPGTQVGQLRQDVYSALATLAQSKIIPCSNFTVDIIETGTGGVSAAIASLAPSGTTSATLIFISLAIVFVAIVVLSKEI